MKRIGLILMGNLAVLAVLLVILEGVLRLAGMDTIVGLEQKAPAWKTRYQDICRKIATQKLEVYDSFYTDQEGLFKANPEYFGRTDKKILVNRDGFRGRPFEPTDMSRTKILLIGDSFTWGSNAQPISNSYADLLEAAGYHVYNGGIPGTDPQQYAMIAEKYTSLLRPDIVAACVYLGNDVSARPLLIKPNKNLHYVTNFGYLLGYDDSGHFFKDAREAFQYLKKRKCGNCANLWDRLIFKTVIGKGINSLINKSRSTGSDGTKKWVTEAMKRIQDTCHKNDAKFIIFLIPSVNQDIRKNSSIKNNLHLFKDFQYYYPEIFEKSDYREPPDNHFNNQGHKKYADFIMGVLKGNGFEAERRR